MKKKILLASLTILLTFCAIGLTACGHEHDYEVQSSDTMHWYKCECGDTIGYDVHAGGEATCKEKAKCSTCGVEYGELGEHTGGEATCKEKAKCSTCGVEYGNIAPHDYVDSVCKWCQKEQKITFNTLTVNGNKVYGKVRNSTLEFSFKEEVSINGASDYIVSYDKYLSQSVETKIVPLSEGDNIIYVAEKIAGQIGDIYEVTIRRLPIHIVSFDTANGSVVQSQYIEEEYFATIPANPTRAGYVFNSWDYDFSKPITKNTKITASWTANTNTPYKVEYYLENLEDNNYTLNETVNKTGTTDTTVSTTAKNIEHFTFNSYKSNLSGNLNGDGSLVLKVYYTRNKYTLSNANPSLGNITNGGSYKYGKEITTNATQTLGYEFIGWYNGEKLLSTAPTYTFTMFQNVTAKFQLKKGMEVFNFTSSMSTCKITGLKDKAITEVIIPDCVTSIGDSAFSYSALTGVVIPDSVTSIGRSAFEYCRSLRSVEIGDSVTSIGKNAFSYSSLTSVVIPNSVTSIGDEFSYCHSLTSIEIPNSVTSIGEEAFWHCSKLTSVEIPDSVTSIGGMAFNNCTSLTSVEIGNSVTSIGFAAFYCCYSLEAIEIPDSVTSIGYSAFSGCESLTSIVIPDSVTSIGSGAFWGCYSLTSIKYRGTQSQWQAITKGDDWDYYTGNYTIAYNYTGE